jgi:hypothetical protein
MICLRSSLRLGAFLVFALVTATSFGMIQKSTDFGYDSAGILPFAVYKGERYALLNKESDGTFAEFYASPKAEDKKHPRLTATRALTEQTKVSKGEVQHELQTQIPTSNSCSVLKAKNGRVIIFPLSFSDIKKLQAKEFKAVPLENLEKAIEKASTAKKTSNVTVKAFDNESITLRPELVEAIVDNIKNCGHEGMGGSENIFQSLNR